jgi:hypothetical protein
MAVSSFLILAGMPHGQPGQQDLGERADGQRVGHGAGPEAPAQDDAGRQRGELDQRADQAQRVPASGQAGHQPVARSRPQPGADVAGRGQRVQPDPGGQPGHPPGQCPGRGQHVQRAVDDQADHDRVADRAQARPLPERDPGQQDQPADRDGDPADLHPEMAGDALVQDIPRAQAQPGPYHQGQADPEPHQPQVQAHQARRQVIAGDHRGPMRAAGLDRRAVR